MITSSGVRFRPETDINLGRVKIKELHAVTDIDKPNELWDETVISDLPGKLLLVGLTFLDIEGNPSRQEQRWGRVVRVDQRAGIELMLQGTHEGETFSLPPDTRWIKPASPGDYRLRSTGEVVTNPDYTVSFTVQEE